MEKSTPANRPAQLAVATIAAFCTYFCMYAFRKPFTAATFDGQTLNGFDFKTALVLSQLVGYMLSKFIGIKVISEMRSEYRAVSILGLIFTAQAALVGFAYAPHNLKILMLFFNGLPLGMVFGLVLSFLEGRRQTEALAAGLCASFIISSGVVKSVGRYLLQDFGVSEFQMPMMTGWLFLPPLLVAVWILQKTPPPDQHDLAHRSERKAVNRSERNQFLRAYLPGLALLVFVYVALTVVRTVRDDFGVEIWRDLGVAETPSIFATSETVVAIGVTFLNALAIWIRHNVSAIRITIIMMCMSFGLVALSTILQSSAGITPFLFMVGCGIGLYVPYVAFHTTVFERIIAASRRPSNLGFLMYVADAMGYLGYAVVISMRTAADHSASISGDFSVLPFFRWALLIGSGLSVLALIVALVYFQRVLPAKLENVVRQNQQKEPA